jgi:hypothetical protein
VAHHPFSALRLLITGKTSPNSHVQTLSAMLRINLRDNFGDRLGAMRDALENLALTEARGDVWMAAASRMEIGSLYGQVGEFDSALENYRIAIDLMDKIGSEQDSRQARGYVVATLIGSGRIEEARSDFDLFAQGWQPGDPDPQVHPEIAAGILVAAAELDSYGGATASAAELYERAVRLLLTEHPMPAQDPFVAMIISTAVCGMALSGLVERTPPYLSDLAAIARHMFGRGGMGDLPQLGSIAMACGASTCLRNPGSPDGVRLLHLADRVGGSRGFPTLATAMDRRAELSGVTAEVWNAVGSEIAEMSRRQAVRDILDIIERLSA